MFAYGQCTESEFLVHEDLIDNTSVDDDVYHAFLDVARKVGW